VKKDVRFWENLHSTHHNQLLGYSTLWGSRWPHPHTQTRAHTHIHTHTQIYSEMLKIQNSRLCIIIYTFTTGAQGLMIFKLHRFNVKCSAKCKQWTQVVVEERSCSLVYRITLECPCRKWGKQLKPPVMIASFKSEWNVWWISYESNTQTFLTTS